MSVQPVKQDNHGYGGLLRKDRRPFVAQESLSMRKIREILLLREPGGYNKQESARGVGCTRSRVRID